VTWDGGSGDAIATAFDDMIYLVVAHAGDTVAAWIAAGSLSASALART
jgi:C4-dicarboxylate transporter